MFAASKQTCRQHSPKLSRLGVRVPDLRSWRRPLPYNCDRVSEAESPCGEDTWPEVLTSSPSLQLWSCVRSWVALWWGYLTWGPDVVPFLTIVIVCQKLSRLVVRIPDLRSWRRPLPYNCDRVSEAESPCGEGTWPEILTSSPSLQLWSCVRSWGASQQKFYGRFLPLTDFLLKGRLSPAQHIQYQIYRVSPTFIQPLGIKLKNSIL